MLPALAASIFGEQADRARALTAQIARGVEDDVTRPRRALLSDHSVPSLRSHIAARHNRNVPGPVLNDLEGAACDVQSAQRDGAGSGNRRERIAGRVGVDRERRRDGAVRQRAEIGGIGSLAAGDGDRNGFRSVGKGHRPRIVRLESGNREVEDGRARRIHLGIGDVQGERSLLGEVLVDDVGCAGMRGQIAERIVCEILDRGSRETQRQGAIARADTGIDRNGVLGAIAAGDRRDAGNGRTCQPRRCETEVARGDAGHGIGERQRIMHQIEIIRRGIRRRQAHECRRCRGNVAHVGNSGCHGSIQVAAAVVGDNRRQIDGAGGCLL